MSQVKWIDEQSAANKLGYTSRRYFRNRVKSGELGIARTDNGKGRVFLYNEKDIDRILLANSTYVNRQNPSLV